MYYKIYDTQLGGYFGDHATFKTKEQVRDTLADFHSIDWDSNTYTVENAPLDYLLDIGQWKLDRFIK